MKREAILNDFLSYCQPGPVPGRWSISDAMIDVWRCPKNVDEALQALVNKHGHTSLVRAGLILDSPKQKLELSGAFAFQNSSFLALRRSENGAPFDLLADNGSVSGRLPLYSACRDYRIAADLAQQGFVLLTFSLPDFVAMRAVGLPAAPATGLGHFTAKTAREFRKLFESTLKTPESGLKRPALVGWSPSNWSLHRPSGLDEVISNLRATADSLVPQSIDEICLWRPDNKQMRSIADCLGTGAASAAVHAVVESLNESAVSLSPERAKIASTPGLLDSSIKLRQELFRRDGTPKTRKQKLRAHQQAVQNELVAPLLKQAADESDPIERNRLHAIAALAQVIPSVATSCAVSIEDAIAHHGLRGYEGCPQVAELVKVTEALFKLMKRR